MKLIQARAFGEIEVDERQIIDFPRGILGFQEHTRFALLDASQPPFYWLQSLTDTQTAFVLISPDVFRSDYELSLVSQELDVIDVHQEEGGELITRSSGDAAELLVFAIVTVTGDKESMTANLQGPIVINPASRLGMQGIQTDPRWMTKHYILQEMAVKGSR
jgi:flagellar assembly factor FliW